MPITSWKCILCMLIIATTTFYFQYISSISSNITTSIRYQIRRQNSETQKHHRYIRSITTQAQSRSTNASTIKSNQLHLTSSPPSPPPSPPNNKILITVATALGRRWITLLSLLSITNAITQMSNEGYDVHLLISFVGYPYDLAIHKLVTLLSPALNYILLVEHVNVTKGQGGFVRSREHLVDYFLNDAMEQYTHWMHLDDDMLIGHDHSLTRSIQEYDGNVKHIGGLLVLFLNSWSKPSKPKVNHGTLTQIRYAGAPAFLISKKTLIKIGGNPYTSCRLYRPKNCPDGEAANEWFWNKLKTNKMSLLSNINQSYSVQHLANSQSLIFGKQLGWENLWATDRNIKHRVKLKNGKYKKTIVQVPPYLLEEVRKAVRPVSTKKGKSFVHSKLGHSEDLVRYVVKMNGHVGTVNFPFNEIDELKEDLAFLKIEDVDKKR